MEITKAQHFVWRKYIENWSVKDKVYVKYINRNISGQYLTRTILRENYMYEFPILNRQEFDQLKKFIEKFNIKANLQNAFITICFINIS